MTNPAQLLCDGCGQSVDSGHIAARLQRLEWATRFRPVHIHTLLLGSVSPTVQEEFLYAPEGEFQGEARRILEVAGTDFSGKAREAVHAEFQRAGFFLTHVLECPLGDATRSNSEFGPIIDARSSFVATRIRRSLKPRRVVLISGFLAPLTTRLTSLQLECPVILDAGKPFALDSDDDHNSLVRAREALAVPAVAR